MKKDCLNKWVILLLILNFCITGVMGICLFRLNGNPNIDETDQYVMYVGLNDKDTYTQVISTEDAVNMIDSICLQYLEGYTVQEATGSWVDEKGLATHEKTIICYFDNTNEEIVHEIADELLECLNQNTVLIEQNKVRTEFYGGIK